MSQELQISTITTTSVVSGVISILTKYFPDELPNTVNGFLANQVASQDGVSYQEGELVIQMINSPEEVYYTINNNGDLLISTSTGDSENYSINSLGELVWTGEI